jgi:PAS domain S-box-containing protein
MTSTTSTSCQEPGTEVRPSFVADPARQQSPQRATWRGDEPFRQLADGMPVGLWISDVEGATIRYVNAAMTKIVGRRLMVGDGLDHIHHAIHPDDAEKVADPATGLRDGRADLDCRLTRADGTVRWVHIRTVPIGGPNGDAGYIAGIVDDITERVEAGLRAERLKDEFIATVSHELRTPLTSIGGALGLLIGSARGLPDSVLRLLTIANNNSQRLNRLVNDILDIEKIASGKVVFVRKRIELRTLAEQAIEANRGFADVYGVSVRLDGASAIGQVHSDPDRLFQVVTNLLSNAIKFSPSGEEVVVAVEQRRGAVRLSVRDHGHGVPDEFKSRIFEKFAQADATDTRRQGGTGLGLSIVKEIVTRLGGEVGFGDAPGGGAIFHVELPALETVVDDIPVITDRPDLPCTHDAPVTP